MKTRCILNSLSCRSRTSVVAEKPRDALYYLEMSSRIKSHKKLPSYYFTFREVLIVEESTFSSVQTGQFFIKLSKIWQKKSKGLFSYKTPCTRCFYIVAIKLSALILFWPEVTLNDLEQTSIPVVDVAGAVFLRTPIKLMAFRIRRWMFSQPARRKRWKENAKIRKNRMQFRWHSEKLFVTTPATRKALRLWRTIAFRKSTFVFETRLVRSVD